MNKATMLVTTVYVLACLAAGVSYYLTPNLDFILRLFVADIVATLIVFGASVGFRNASLYDPYWSIAPPLIGLWLWLLNPQDMRLLIMLVLISAWGVRLTRNWLRTWHGLDIEDWRYQSLKMQTGRFYGLVSLCGIHLFPTILVFLGCLSLFAVAEPTSHPLNSWDLIAIFVTSLSIWLEHKADQELHEFRSTRVSPSAVLKTGSWAFCRHPNYLGEIGFWIGLYLFSIAATAAPWHWALAGPTAMIILFVGISIPMIETKLSEEKPTYRAYQASTPMLIGWPKRASRQ
jgi:steroid 5-alpha reductase family enzyme